jgi:hypothetical protein
MDEASLVRAVPWTSRPLDEPSLGRGVPGMRRPLDDMSLTDGHWDRLSLCWVRLGLGPGSGQIGQGRHDQGPHRPRDALSAGHIGRGHFILCHRRRLVVLLRAANDQHLALCM